MPDLGQLTEDLGPCQVCGAPGVVRKVIDEVFTYEGQTVTVPDYVIYDCAVCGEAISDWYHHEMKMADSVFCGLLGKADLACISVGLFTTSAEKLIFDDKSGRCFRNHNKSMVPLISTEMYNLARTAQKGADIAHETNTEEE